MFLTTYDRDASRSVPSGSRYKDEFQLVTEPDGNTHLEVTGTKDIYKEIQSYKDGCMIENIVRRALNGDPTALSRHAEAFGDVRFDANDLIAANEAIKRAQSIYRSLAPEKRAEYGNFDEFVKSFGSLDGIKKYMNPSKKDSAKQEEVNSNAEQTA